MAKIYQAVAILVVLLCRQFCDHVVEVVNTRMMDFGTATSPSNRIY